MDIPLNVEVYCSDGKCGRSAAIIVDRPTRQVTHFVLQNEGSEYLVPISVITESSPLRISLSWTREELTRAEPFLREVPASDEQIAIMAAAMTQSSVMGPYTSPDAAYMVNYLSNATVPQEQVSANEVAIHQDDRVEATDGSAGRVDELIIDPQTGRITHLVLRTGHLWGKRDIFVPLEQVDHVADNVIYLKLDRKAVEGLPAVHAPKK